jgi:putative PEP-CTERM system TPR-repeat lipoprotein
MAKPHSQTTDHRVRRPSLPFFGCIVLAALISLSAACQPAPEDQFARAEVYMAEADYRSAIIEVRNVLRAKPDHIAARLLLATASAQIADFPTAESAYIRALELGDESIDAWVGLGRSLLAQGKTLEAFERVAPYLKERSGDEEAFVLLGDIRLSLGNLDDADAEYVKAIDLNPASAGGLIGRAVIAASNSDHDRAREYLELALQGNAESTKVWRAQGNYLRTITDFEGAIAAYDRAIEFESAETSVAGRFTARINRLSTLIDLRRFEQARTDLEELRQILPGHPSLGFLKGRIAYGLEEYEAAQVELQQYVSQVPNDPRGNAALGAVNFSQDNFRQAELYLAQAVRTNIGGEGTRRLLAETRLRLNKPEEALAALREAESEGQSDAMLLAMLARAEIGVGDTDAAISHFEQGVAAEPDNVTITMALAATYLQAGRNNDALALLENFQTTSDTGFRREMLIMSAHLRNGDADKATAVGNQLITENADNGSAYSIVGAMHQSMGNNDKARENFERALALEPENLVALYSLGNLAYSANDLDQAKQLYEKLLDSNPSFVPGLTMLASILQKEGALENLQTRADAAMIAAPESISVHILAARLALTRNDADEALRIIARVQDDVSGSATLTHLEGLALVQSGQPVRGLRSLTRAAENEPQNTIYHFDLARARFEYGDYDGARDAIIAYRALQPQDIRGLAVLVAVELRLRQPNRVRAVVVEYVDSHPEDMTALTLLGDVELAVGEPATAAIYYDQVANSNWDRQIALKSARAHRAAGTGNEFVPLRRWLQENPDDSDMRFVYAQMLEGSGNIDFAISQYEDLVEQGKANAVIFNNLAWQYFQRGQANAVEFAEQAHELDPGNGSITDTLAWIVFQGGDVERALPLLREAVDQSPDNLEIQFHLASVLAGAGENEEAAEIVHTLLDSGKSFPSRADAQRLANSL